LLFNGLKSLVFKWQYLKKPISLGDYAAKQRHLSVSLLVDNFKSVNRVYWYITHHYRRYNEQYN